MSRLGCLILRIVIFMLDPGRIGCARCFGLQARKPIHDYFTPSSSRMKLANAKHWLALGILLACLASQVV